MAHFAGSHAQFLDESAGEVAVAGEAAEHRDVGQVAALGVGDVVVGVADAKRAKVGVNAGAGVCFEDAGQVEG